MPFFWQYRCSCRPNGVHCASDRSRCGFPNSAGMFTQIIVSSTQSFSVRSPSGMFRSASATSSTNPGAMPSGSPGDAAFVTLMCGTTLIGSLLKSPKDRGADPVKQPAVWLRITFPFRWCFFGCVLWRLLCRGFRCWWSG